MNRETSLHFGAVPEIEHRRSKFDMSHSVHTTFNVGDIIPLYVDTDILAGDTVELDLHSIARMATPIAPVMDNLIMDVYGFFVPHRLTWDHWPNFWGENNDPWTTNLQEYEVPQIEAPSGGWTRTTIADYMGIPTYKDGFTVNAFAFRSYAKIWSDWFRDENLKSASHFYTDDTTRTGTNGTDYVTDPELGGMPCKAAKTHDYFTSALPTPQRGPSVKIPIGTSAPVYTFDDIHHYNKRGLHWENPLTDLSAEDLNLVTNGSGYTNGGGTSTPSGPEIAPNNLWADLKEATASTINELRTAFAIQKYYEANARYGTRYIEWLRAIFGVHSSDARLQRSEYLGGCRIPINMDAIVQTSSTDVTSPQGNAAGYSCTLNSDSLFTKSFEEHGTLMLLAVCRVAKRSYQQGLNQMWTRKKWTDFYNPFFANLGELPIKNKEIYLQGDSVVDTDGNIIDDQVFGYQEAWASYRYKNNLCTGDMRSYTPAGSLDIYHYADNYNALPTLGSTWIDEPKANVDRTIAVTSQKSHQIIMDAYLKMSYTRVMPVYSMPGLIDHV